MRDFLKGRGSTNGDIDCKQSAGGLKWRHFPGGAGEFFRAPVLLSGTREAILVDGGWTFRGGHSVVDAIRATGKTLSVIYVSESDPDYYFNLRSIVSKFPQAKVLATPARIDAILKTVQGHLDTWQPYLQDNGPRTLRDIVLPQPHTDTTIWLEDRVIEIVETKGLLDRRYLYVSALDAVFGGNMLFGGVHVWTADVPTSEQRIAWIAELNALAARSPKIVVPGHMASNARCDSSAVAFTRDYLLAFEEECTKGGGSETLIRAMSRHYPNAEMRIALAIGAKVAKGEMIWAKQSQVQG